MLSMSVISRFPSEVNFAINENKELTVTIDTESLHMRSIEDSEADLNSYAGLFGDAEVMGKYATGQTKTKEEIGTRIKDSWVKRWKENDPYSALAVFTKQTEKFSDEFVGHVVLGYGDAPGQSEMAYLFHKNSWNKGFGTEAVTALVKDYAPAIKEKGYLLEGKALEEIQATTRIDNTYSVRILEKVGMEKIAENEKFGGMRNIYSIKV
jgi:RimJ/RimL family protein N-acetyltransferase